MQLDPKLLTPSELFELVQSVDMHLRKGSSSEGTLYYKKTSVGLYEVQCFVNQDHKSPLIVGNIIDA